MKHGHIGRFNYQQHGPGVVGINKTLIQQRLLVKFSCDPHINSLLRALLPCVIIRLCVQWLPQHYKANAKANPLRLETKQGELYLYTFKCVNCRGNHQADSNLCLFWKHCFHSKWHSNKYQELYDNRRKLICSIMSRTQV